jgi:hypothetical protein
MVSLFTAGLTRLIIGSILCGDHAIKQIDKPFITPKDDADEWAL